VISLFISSMLNGRLPLIYGDGADQGFVCVDDVVRANILASCSQVTGLAINVAGRSSTSLNRLGSLIGNILGCNVRPDQRDPRAGDIRDSLADISRAREIGYEPETRLKDGLAETIEWFSSRICHN
jgi:UDP-glucose 4-epimerase